MTSNPYCLPPKLEADLSLLLGYWDGLKRGDAEMPFADDVDPTALPNPDGMILIEVSETPMRFRVAMAGAEIRKICGDVLAGAFLDEIAGRYPLDYLHSQSSATVEGRTPTYYRHRPDSGRDDGPYARLMMPTWGDGRINMLLGAFTRS
ncbi:PAS domain-containing protein [Bradyrhizobium sp. WD16]|uniref:PAS domain-containing protein n=1 Tax=Bradyrhizobium sp. WD16 TaxID=1521768 RepID=UPI0020A4F6D3|nr:PAS domain-containing protein [Bradyrhizobium sp. WD16]